MNPLNKILTTFLFALAINAVHATCPDGQTEYIGTIQDDVARNSNGVCAPLCEYGGTKLVSSTGLNINLFTDQTTFPSIHIELNDGVCYADLVKGRMANAINISTNDNSLYHTTINDIPCPKTYTLSYNCGNGATGTPPESIEVAYGDLYTVRYDAGGCRKPGYYLSGWKIDDTLHTKGHYYNYNYTTDKTIVAQWTANLYGGAYICNNNTTSKSYISATFGSTITPSTTECTAPTGKKFAGYTVYDTLGNNTGNTIAKDASFVWTYPYNIQLRARWTNN